MKHKEFLPLVGGLVAAVAASSCCILPLVLGAASAGTLAIGAALTPYRPYLIGLTLLMLAAAFYCTYHPRKTGRGTDGCATVKSAPVPRFSRAFLGAITVITLGVMIYPDFAAHALESAQVAVPPVPSVPSAQTAIFTLGDLTCPECSISIVKALKGTPGVLDASVNFAAKYASVRYDSRRISISELRKVIEQTGFPVAGMTD